jgi:hypothetical protein
LLHRLLHLDPAASYVDQEMSGETERVEKCLSAIPVREDTVTLITVIHLTGRPLFNSDALDAIGKIVKRAASLQVLFPSLSSFLPCFYLLTSAGCGDGCAVLQDPEALRITNPQLVEALLKLTLYNPPAGFESIVTPLSVVSAYWNALVMLVLIGSFNVKHVGQAIWQR